VGPTLPADCNCGAAQTTFDFDVQGNLANKNGQAYVFSQDNRLREVTNKEYYRYDSQGRRILSFAPGLPNMFFFYTHDGRMVYETDGRRGKLIDYVYFAGSLVATREKSTADNSVVVKYQHTDALGTPVAQTGANRAVLERSEYEPYGRLMDRPIDDRIGFTGHMQDTQTGLTYMQQRYYDPVAGVFLSADPVAVRSAGDNFHRYRYANNNPYRYVDPDGRETAMFQAERYQMPPPDPAATRTALGLIADFTPGVGDAMGIYEALQEPSVFNVLGAGVGLVPVVGDVGGKLIKNADNIANGAAGLWTATKSQTVAENAFRHFKEHGADFDARNAVEYVRQAAEFLHRPGAGVLSRTRANGDVVRFDPASNAFGVMDKSGAPRTFFKPDPAQHGYPTNLDYFDVQ
jgi:RHS repeat-associated protein